MRRPSSPPRGREAQFQRYVRYRKAQSLPYGAPCNIQQTTGMLSKGTRDFRRVPFCFLIQGYVPILNTRVHGTQRRVSCGIGKAPSTIQVTSRIELLSSKHLLNPNYRSDRIDSMNSRRPWRAGPRIDL